MTTQTITLTIAGMTCGGCVKSISNALNQITGVQQAHVSLEQNNATITFDDTRTDERALKQAIEDAGFDIA